MSQALNKIKFHAVKALTRLAIDGLDNGIREQRRTVKDFHQSALPVLIDQKMVVAERFMTAMNGAFEALLGTAPKAFHDQEYEAQAEPEDPSLLEPRLAMEGMIAHTRNCDIEENIGFYTRLNHLAPELQIDESNNPLDPGQIGEAFVQALAPLQLPGDALLTTYREFNKAVFHKLVTVLHEANGILVDMGVLPELDITARNRDMQRTKRSARRPTTSRETRAFADAEPGAAVDSRGAELFATLQTLYRALVQENTGVQEDATSEIITLVDLLYRAIDRDVAIPEPIKQILLRTEKPTLKIALADPRVLADESHPARVLLEAIALEGVGWMTFEDVTHEPVYRKAVAMVEMMETAPQLTPAYVETLSADFRRFVRDHGPRQQSLEQRIAEAAEAADRLRHIEEYAAKKIQERLVKAELDLSIRELLDTHIKEFLVRLLLREGPGGAGWGPAINTIDILIWSVQADKAEGDRARFEKINAKLVANLDKILTLAGVSKTRKARILRQLRQVQDYTFHVAKERSAERAAAPAQGAPSTAAGSESLSSASASHSHAAVDARYLRQVDHLPIGTWVEFTASAGQGLRCTLAARIPSIDKLFFVNGQGVKVLETSRNQLAHELESGSVQIVSDGPLLLRAMDAVIAELREALTSIRAAKAPPEPDAPSGEGAPETHLTPG